MSKIGKSIRLHIILPLAEKAIGTCSTKWLKQIQTMSLWTQQEVKAWQNERLQALVKHVYEHTKYYRRIFDERGLTPEDIQCIDDLKKLPIINKEIAIAYYDEIVPDHFAIENAKLAVLLEHLCYFY